MEEKGERKERKKRDGDRKCRGDRKSDRGRKVCTVNGGRDNNDINGSDDKGDKEVQRERERERERGGIEVDIRFINRKREIINGSNLSIKVMNQWLIGIDSKANIVEIEKYGSLEEAENELKKIGKKIKEEVEKNGDRGIVIDLKEGEEGKE